MDADGRRVILVGAHALRSLPAGEEAIRSVLDPVAEGHVPHAGEEGVTARNGLNGVM